MMKQKCLKQDNMINDDDNFKTGAEDEKQF